jgi:hypothetical protein
MFIPTLYTTRRATAQKMEGLALSGAPVGALTLPPGATWCSNYLTLLHMQGNIMKINPIIDLWWFHPREEKGCHTD